MLYSAADHLSEQPIGFLLQRAHHVVRERLITAIAGENLHLGHVTLLATVKRSPGISQRDISARTGIEKSSVVIFADALERRGLLRRTVSPSDRRARAVEITAAGSDLLTHVGPGLQEAEALALSALSPAEREALANSLVKLIRGAIGAA